MELTLYLLSDLFSQMGSLVVSKTSKVMMILRTEPAQIVPDIEQGLGNFQFSI